MEAKDPHMFEANRSNLRVFSMTEVGYSVGMMVGPLLSGSLVEGVGFFFMTVALGEHPDWSNISIEVLTFFKLPFASPKLAFRGAGSTLSLRHKFLASLHKRLR
jgi:hypothetical protein